MSLKDKAQEVLAIIDAGGFEVSGRWTDISAQVKYCVENSRTYAPVDDEPIASTTSAEGKGFVIEVTDESTQLAAKRLVHEGCDDLVLLNFASAHKPGGGFINGAKAQEEDLARCSALYPCLTSQVEYYESNHAQASMLYTDYAIYSPKVPWFRTRSCDNPNELFFASVITAPAPNARLALSQGNSAEEIESVLQRRCRRILSIAKDNAHRSILLGAWGCGVFGNNPSTVARAFHDALKSPAFSSAFDRVVFAIYDQSMGQKVLATFKSKFDST